MRVYPRNRTWAVTDDFGEIIAEFDTEERALREMDWIHTSSPAAVRSRHPRVNAPKPAPMPVPEGRSWFVSRRTGVGSCWEGWEVEEHRISPSVLGTDTLSAPGQVRIHQCATEAEIARLRRSLSDQGLFDRGIQA